MFTPADFSHNNATYIPDPFPFYAQMRERSPVFFSEGIFGGTWLFFRYADCVRLLADERLSNSRAAVPLRFLPAHQRAECADMVDLFERWLAFHDGDQHSRSRRLANRSYVPFSAEVLEPRIQARVDQLLDAVDPREFDLMSTFAFPLPAMVIADVLGVPVEAHQDLTRWTDDIAHLFGSTKVSAGHVYRTRDSVRELAKFLASPSSRASAERQGGLLALLSTAEVHGRRFSEEDVVAQAALLLFAGVASIRYLIGNSVFQLSRLPDQDRLLLLDRDTVDQAVEELLRYCTPVQFVGRVVAEDFAYTADNGQRVQLRSGQPLILYVASANRDPGQFTSAGDLMMTRPAPNAHLTFGAGRHLCFGDPLVRQTFRIALSTLYRRMPNLAAHEQSIDWNNNLGFHGFTALRVTNPPSGAGFVTEDGHPAGGDSGKRVTPAEGDDSGGRTT
ncbi:cytochrome P450 [Streptomyces microflavus]|uniref:cytochrome P450 n=1 Tax=Streptomyces microflavus TaxID=1919 RepID=UPI00366138CF